MSHQRYCHITVAHTRYLPRVFPSGVRHRCGGVPGSCRQFSRRLLDLVRSSGKKCIASSTWGSVDSRGAGVSCPVCCRARNGIGRPGLPDRNHRVIDRRYAIGGVCRLSGRMRFESPCWHRAWIKSSGGHRRDRSGDGSGEDFAVISNKKEAGVRNEPRPDMDCPPSSSIQTLAGRPDSREAYRS